MARLLMAAAAVLALSGLAGAEPADIFGDDNRHDLCAVKDPKIRELAKSVAAVIPLRHLVPVLGSARLMRVEAATLQKRYALAPGQRFADQPTGAECTGALVAPNLILTAGHCVRKGCDGLAFAFGFSIENEADPQLAAMLWTKDVYYCGRVVRLEAHADPEADWALVRLSRRVEDRAPLQLAQADASTGAAVFTIGHPSGLPAKLADGARVLAVDKKEHFLADLDVFRGNSGSPVFDKDHRIVGVVARLLPGLDYVDTREGAAAHRVVERKRYEGTQVTKVSRFRPYLEALTLPIIPDPATLRLRERLALPEIPAPERWVMPWEPYRSSTLK